MTDSIKGWRAGAASRPFPVPVGTPMSGYMARTGPSTGTNAELEISALVLATDSDSLAIVAADLAGVDAKLVSEIAIGSGLPEDRLILCASHTHSGPSGVIARLHPADHDLSNPDLRARFVTTVVGALNEARDSLEPVELLLGSHETTGLAANRNDLSGPYDPTVTTIAARRADGSYPAVLVHFACHPTILSAESRVISSEFPGAMRQSLAGHLAAFGDNATVLYVNGAAGDVSTRFTRNAQDRAEVERVGNGIADAACIAIDSARPLSSLIGAASICVELPPRSDLADDETDRTESQSTTSELNPRVAETRAQGGVLLQRLREAGVGAIQTTFELRAWAIGELAVIAVPGELFASLGAHMTADLGGPTLVFGYSNGYVGYLADRSAYESGTYEALASPFAPGAGELLVESARELLRDLRLSVR